MLCLHQRPLKRTEIALLHKYKHSFEMLFTSINQKVAFMQMSVLCGMSNGNKYHVNKLCFGIHRIH